MALLNLPAVITRLLPAVAKNGVKVVSSARKSNVLKTIFSSTIGGKVRSVFFKIVKHPMFKWVAETAVVTGGLSLLSDNSSADEDDDNGTTGTSYSKDLLLSFAMPGVFANIPIRKARFTMLVIKRVCGLLVSDFSKMALVYTMVAVAAGIKTSVSNTPNGDAVKRSMWQWMKSVLGFEDEDEAAAFASIEKIVDLGNALGMFVPNAKIPKDPSALLHLIADQIGDDPVMTYVFANAYEQIPNMSLDKTGIMISGLLVLAESGGPAYFSDGNIDANEAEILLWLENLEQQQLAGNYTQEGYDYASIKIFRSINEYLTLA